jgi:hypothetical protein
MVPHFLHTIFGPNEGTVTSPRRWSTFIFVPALAGYEPPLRRDTAQA